MQCVDVSPDEAASGLRGVLARWIGRGRRAARDWLPGADDFAGMVGLGGRSSDHTDTGAVDAVDAVTTVEAERRAVGRTITAARLSVLLS